MEALCSHKTRDCLIPCLREDSLCSCRPKERERRRKENIMLYLFPHGLIYCSFCPPVQMYITSTIKTKSSRLAKPVLCLGTLCSAFLTGLNRVSEYRNHCSDVVAGFILGSAIALFLVRTMAEWGLEKREYDSTEVDSGHDLFSHFQPHLGTDQNQLIK